ncbi:MAG: hypothetical protein RLZZ303_698 [Candidatus Hydrogenedentota bacterium]
MSRILEPTPDALREAAKVLRDGGVVAYPTETVYGLAADPFNPEALRRLFAIKQRSDTKPVLLIVSSEEQLELVAAPLSDRAERCIHAFWPGPVSLVLSALEELPPEIASQGKVCVRCTAHEVAAGLCAAFGAPVTSTSANLSGQPPATTAKAACLPGVDLVLDGGDLPPFTPSTVYDPDARLILRDGAVGVDELRALVERD